MILAFRFIALTLAPVSLTASLITPLSAQSADAAAPGTLGDWIARDQAVGRQAPSAERTAALDGLQRDVVTALQAARAALEAQAAAAPKPATCLPPPGTTQLTSDEIGMWLYTRPASEYADTMEQVMMRFLAHRFPCP
jgi:hypothetical protein